MVLRVEISVEINQECLIELLFPYIMQIFIIHKQAQFTKKRQWKCQPHCL